MSSDSRSRFRQDIHERIARSRSRQSASTDNGDVEVVLGSLENAHDNHDRNAEDENYPTSPDFASLAEARRPAPSARALKTRYGSYEIMEILGQGGMGCVYRARHRLMNRIVALKTIRANLFQSADAVQRFLNEIEAVGQLNHPNITTALYADQDEDEYYLAMEYIEGATLIDLVDPSHPLPLDQACDWVAQAASGLAHAHLRGIVHRDIKPNNLMLTREGIVKVLDLGLAQFSMRGDAFDRDHPVGTPDYMSPEHWLDPRTVDLRSDIYSLGCVLYFLCAGRHVFGDSSTFLAKRQAHVTQEPPPLGSVRSDMREDLEAIYRKMVAKRPEERFPTMGAAARALRELSFDQPSSIAIPIPATQAPAPRSSTGKSAQAGGQRSDNALRMKLIWCPAGSFAMGSSAQEPGHQENEGPAAVTLTRGFWMGRTPVTQEQWRTVMGTTLRQQRDLCGPAHPLPGEGPSHPICFVSHSEAEEFCRRLTCAEREAGRLPKSWEYRLPTEAQWEYACRAGSRAASAFGDSLDSSQANFDGGRPYPEEAGQPGPYLRRTTQVGSYPPNAWGLLDMHGNVWEWCRDPYAPQLLGGTDPEPWSESSSQARVVRGGGWNSSGEQCRSARRSRRAPDFRGDFLGFRVAVVKTKD